MSTEIKPAPGAPSKNEQRLQELNDWVAWLESWTSAPPGYRSDGPLEQTRGLKRLTNFLRGLAYDWPVR